MLIFLRNNSLQLSFIIVQGFLVHPRHAGRLSVIHTIFLPVLLNLQNPSHVPLTLCPVSFSPCYWMSTPNQSPNHSPSDVFLCFPLSPSSLYSSFLPSSFLSVHCWGDSGADKQGEKISAGVPQDWRERMAARQQRRGRYIDWYEVRVNYRGLPIRGWSDGSVCLAAASQKHHQLPPCLSSAATRPQLPSAITGDSLDTKGGYG